MLRLTDVGLRRAGRMVLDQVSLSVDAGELLLVVGPRGGGKTSLLAVAAGALQPERGTVELGGRDVGRLQRASLPFVRRNIGYLPPQPPLISDETALENVMLALAVRGASIATAWDEAGSALADLGVGDTAQVLVRRLSAGERRLVALARALAGAPVLVALDDPTAGLGAADRKLVATAIRGARAGGAAVLCATTDDALADALSAAGGRRATLEAGRLSGGAAVISLVGAARSAGDQHEAADSSDAPAVPDAEKSS